MADEQQQETGIVQYETDHGDVKLSPRTVRNYLVSGGGNVSDQEVMMFMALCKYQQLNPFLREAYLIKYGGDQPAAMVTGKEVFTKRAAKHPAFDGFEAGVTLMKGGNLERREGSLVLDGEDIIAGWAKVYLKGLRVPIFAEASFKEYAGRKRDGSLNKTWAGKPATMIRKVALVQALREAFPEQFQGLYDEVEMAERIGDNELPSEPVDESAPPAPQQPAPQQPTGAVTIDEAKQMVMPEGSKYPGLLLTDVVKDDLKYAKWCTGKGCRNERLRAAFALLVAAWEAYLAKHPENGSDSPSEPDEDAACETCQLDPSTCFMNGADGGKGCPDYKARPLDGEVIPA